MSWSRAKTLGIGGGIALVVAAGFWASMGSMIPSSGLPRCESAGERLEWNGNAWGCKQSLNLANTTAWQTGTYYYLGNTAAASTSSTGSNNQMRCYPFTVPNPVTLTRLALEVTTAGDAGSKVRPCLYADNGVGRPGTLLLDGGQIAGDAAAVTELTVSTAITAPGVYYKCVVFQSVTSVSPTIRVDTPAGLSPGDTGASLPSNLGTISIGYSQTSVSSGCPSTASMSPNASGSPPRMLAKVQ